MKKNFVTKLFVAVLFIGVFSLMFLINNVRASNDITNNKKTNTKNIAISETDVLEDLNEEEKIIKYDAITNETTEMDVEDLIQNAKTLREVLLIIQNHTSLL